jgi:hypothetical protein
MANLAVATQRIHRMPGAAECVIFGVLLNILIKTKIGTAVTGVRMTLASIGIPDMFKQRQGMEIKHGMSMESAAGYVFL